MNLSCIRKHLQYIILAVNTVNVICVMIVFIQGSIATYLNAGTTLLGLSTSYYPVVGTVTYCPDVQCIISNDIMTQPLVVYTCYSYAEAPIENNVWYIDGRNIIALKILFSGIWANLILCVLTFILKCSKPNVN